MDRGIDTARLVLRPFVADDADDVFAYASNPRVAQYTSWRAHRSVAESVGFIRMVLARGPEAYTWAIRLRDDPRVVGAIEFSCEPGDRAEIHYTLAEPLWNRGLMTEAARAVLLWGCRRHPQLRRIATRAHTPNVASLRVMEKCGLRRVGPRLFESEKDGGTIEQIEYAIERAADDPPLHELLAATYAG